MFCVLKGIQRPVLNLASRPAEIHYHSVSTWRAPRNRHRVHLTFGRQPRREFLRSFDDDTRAVKSWLGCTRKAVAQVYDCALFARAEHTSKGSAQSLGRFSAKSLGRTPTRCLALGQHLAAAPSREVDVRNSPAHTERRSSARRWECPFYL